MYRQVAASHSAESFTCQPPLHFTAPSETSTQTVAHLINKQQLSPGASASLPLVRSIQDLVPELCF